MLQSLTRFPPGFAGITVSFSSRRAFTHASKHRVFPATLYFPQLQLERGSKLYNLALKRDEYAYSEGVEVAKDRLVYANINHRVTNGVNLWPNIHLMHEMTRNSIDSYLYSLEQGHAPAVQPHFVSFPKGTAIPESLTLYREKSWNFSLQPTHPMSLDDLNKAVALFYYTSGHIHPYPFRAKQGESLESPWGDAAWDAMCNDDENGEEWMKQ